MQSSKERRRTAHSFEFKKKAVELAKNSRFIADVARKLKVPSATIFYWLKAEEEGRLVKIEKPKRRKPSKAGKRHKYTLEFRLAAIQRVKEVGSLAAVGREMNIPDQTLHNWVEAEKAGRLSVSLSFSADEIRQLKYAIEDRLEKLTAKGQNDHIKILTEAAKKLQG